MKASFKNIGVILAGAADHRQYPNVEEDHRIETLKDEEYEGYKAISRREGYSLENPGMFFIQHVYAATVGSIPQLTQKTKLAEEVTSTYLPKCSLAKWPQKAVTHIISYLEEEEDTPIA